MSSLSVSIVIPAFNEADRLPLTLDRLLAFLKNSRIEGEILIVEDGSSDTTSQIAKNYSQEYPNILALALKKNRGKGAALALGVSAARKDWVLLYDADSATPIEEIQAFQGQIRGDSQVLIASRDIPGSERVIKQPWLRHKLGRLFVLFRKWVVGLRDLEDTQCGFKLMRRDAAEQLFKGIKTPGFLFDVEILGRARILGMPIQEIPVRWYDVPKSKVKVSREIPRIIGRLWRIRKALQDFQRDIDRRGGMGQGADRNSIHPGPGDAPHTP